MAPWLLWKVRGRRGFVCTCGLRGIHEVLLLIIIEFSYCAARPLRYVSREILQQQRTEQPVKRGASGDAGVSYVELAG